MVKELVRTIKRRKGGAEYFYLQHSFRKDGKVVTKELYLGKKIPENLEEIKTKLLSEARETLSEKLEAIRNSFQKEWKKTPLSAREKELRELAISFTYNTNAIEGSTITLEETRQILEDQVAPNKPIKDIRETASHAAVFLQMLKTKETMSKKLVLEWHRNIFRETKPDIAGLFRNYSVRVGSHVAPDWNNIEKLMKKLMAFVNESKVNPVELAARAHYMFEKIHPFGDGNGRIGRLLMNFILWKNNYPMLIIEYKGRKSYYKALHQTEERFVNYFIRRYISVHKKRLR
jgi:Fic family protein